MKRTVSLLVAAALAASMLLFGACGGDEERTAVALDPASLPLGRYSETLDLSVGQMISTSLYVNGETASRNCMYDLIKEVMNINVKSQFSANIGDPYNYQLNLAMVNNDLPDMFFCSQSQLSDLISQGMVADLTEVYEQYASPALRLAMEYQYTGDISVWNNGHPEIERNAAVLEAGSSGGKLYGIPFLSDLFVSCPLVWIRLDWLKKYAEVKGITYSDVSELLPDDFGEYLEIAEWFATGNPDGDSSKATYGMSLGFSAENLNGFANVYGAYPGYYVKNDKGEYVYGTQDENVMQVLNMLNKYYNNGVIDKNSALDGATLKAALANGSIGSFLGEFWSVMSYGLNDAYLVNTQVDWIPWAIRDFDGNVIEPLVPYNVNNNSFYCMSTECPNPEAIIIMANHIVDRFFSDDGEFTQKTVAIRKSEKYRNVASELEMYLPFRLDAPNKNIRYAFDIQKALRTGDASELTLDESTYYTSIVSFINKPTGAGRKFYPYYKIFAENGAYTELINYAEYDYDVNKNDLKVHFKRPAFYTINTREMNEVGGMVSDYETRELIFMFTGDKPVTSETFKAFTDGLNSKGMSKILSALNKR